MAIVQWDPTREISVLQGDMNRLFGRFLGEGGTGEVADARRWVPPIDIAEVDDQFVLHADLPGVNDEDIAIEVQERTLRIAGERRVERTVESGGATRRERSFGRFERQLTLPDGVDASAISASFERGVLELRIPKPVAAQPRRIPIGSATAAGEDRHVSAAEREHSPAPKRSIKERVLANA